MPFGFTAWAHRPLGFMVLALGYRSGGGGTNTDGLTLSSSLLVLAAQGFCPVPGLIGACLDDVGAYRTRVDAFFG